MRDRKTHLPLIIVIAVTVFLGALYVGYNRTLHWLLMEDAYSVGMDWAYHMETHLPELMGSVGTDGSIEDAAEPDHNELAEFALEILAIGNIYQIDFINANCHCDASFGTYLTPLPEGSGEKEVAGATNDGLRGDTPLAVKSASPVGSVTVPSKAELDHVFAKEGSHHFANASENGFRLPQDRALIHSIIQEGRQDIIIRRDAPEFQPHVFAEVFYPVLSGGKTVYLLRILVDLQEREALYETLLAAGSLALLLLVALSFAYPANKFIEITRGKKRSDERARFLANHDLMTGIANRNAFQEQAPRRFAQCKSDRTESLLFLVDIDGFKGINDYYGHHAGDQILKEVAKQLRVNFPDDSLIARIGGDEFAIIASGDSIKPGSEAEFATIPGSFEINLNQRMQKLDVSIAAGMARFPRDGDGLQELMLNADLALYSAKKSDDRSFGEFDAHLRRKFQNRVNVLRDFALALERKQVVPYYQPLICTKTGHIKGFEALARWMHPQKGVLTPAVFHEALEDREIALALGTYMLDAITADMAIWKSRGVPFETIGLNVTDADLLRPGFALNVIGKLAANGLAGNELAIEITENCVFGGDKDIISSKLKELGSAGCHIALDDFGTGYSSITHIKDMPVTALKIDKSFIREIADDSADQAIVRAMVDLGSAIGFKVIAEGVENAEQLNLVQSLGCHLVQGFYYAKAVPAAKVPELIAQINRNRAKMAG
jgi:diguanylate cyclase (GGDEF)-like protein